MLTESGRDHLLARHVTAALGPYLVLDHHRGEARGLEPAHREMHVDRVAVAGIGVGLQQQIVAAFHQGAAEAQIVLVAHDAAVGPAEMGLRQPGARDGGGREAVLRRHAHAVAVIDPGRDGDVRRIE